MECICLGYFSVELPGDEAVQHPVIVSWSAAVVCDGIWDLVLVDSADLCGDP